MELARIAENYKKRFASLFAKQYSKEKYNILHSIEERNKDSLRVFFDTFFGDGVTKRIDALARGADEALIEVLKINGIQLHFSFTREIPI